MVEGGGGERREEEGGSLNPNGTVEEGKGERRRRRREKKGLNLKFNLWLEKGREGGGKEELPNLEREEGRKLPSFVRSILLLPLPFIFPLTLTSVTRTGRRRRWGKREKRALSVKKKRKET